MREIAWRSVMVELERHAGVGRSTRRNPGAAGQEAAERAVAELGRTPSFVLVHATTGYDQELLLAGVSKVVGGVPMSGCSGEGVISRFGADEGAHTVCIMAIDTPGIRFHPMSVPDAGEDPHAAGRTLARLANAIPDARLLVLLADGARLDIGLLLTGIDAELLPSIARAGGAAGAMFALSTEGMKTFEYHDGRVMTGGVAAFVVAGDVVPEVVVSHGCEPMGLDRTVTRAEGSMVYEIDGLPAFQVFKEYLDADTDELGSPEILTLGVGLRLPEEEQQGYGTYLVRTPLALDKATGGLFFAGGGFTDGTRITIARRDPARIRASAGVSGRQLAARHPGESPELVLQFDCAGRGRILFGADVAEHTIDPIREAIGPNVPWIGLHTHGEIATLGSKTHYHNYTVVVCALYAAKTSG